MRPIETRSRRRMGFFKSLIDGLNHRESLAPVSLPTYFARHIVAMHFYHNLIII